VQWERDLEAREQDIEYAYQEAKTRLEDESQRLFKKAEMAVKKQVSGLEKKLLAAQKDLRTKTKLMKERGNLNVSVKSGHLNVSLKSSKGHEESLAVAKRANDMLKTRVSNLEKSYEIMKVKCKTVEEQLEKERTDRNKYQEDYYKMKSKKTITEKDNKDLKEKIINYELQLGHAANQISILENNTTQFNNIHTKEYTLEHDMKINDLDDSHDFESILDSIPETDSKINQVVRLQNIPTDSKGVPKKGKGAVKAKTSIEYVYCKATSEETNLFLELNHLIVTTMDMTLPVIFDNYQNKEELDETSFISAAPKLDYSISQVSDNDSACSPRNLNQEYDISKPKKELKRLNFGEVLYPSFNKLTPKLCEAIFIATSTSESYRSIQNIIGLTWSCVSFAFNSQILEKVVRSIFNEIKFSKFSDKDVNIFDKSFNDSLHHSTAKILPIEIDFKAKTSIFKKKLKELHSTGIHKISNIITKSSENSIQLPIYPLFKDQSVNEIIVNTLLDLICHKEDKPEDKENSNIASNEATLRFRSSSKLKRSIQKPVVKDEIKQCHERKDTISLNLKILCFCIINSLSTNTKTISKALKTIENSFNDQGEDFEQVSELLLEHNALPFIAINLLSDKLVTSSLDILMELVVNSQSKEKIYDQLFDSNIFKVIKLATRKYSNNHNIFNELTTILQRMAVYDSIKMKQYCPIEYVEFLNNEFLKASKLKDTDYEQTLVFGNLGKILKSLN
jgi:hypothetical protein